MVATARFLEDVWVLRVLDHVTYHSDVPPSHFSLVCDWICIGQLAGGSVEGICTYLTSTDLD
jgi:hypothetical protein